MLLLSLIQPSIQLAKIGEIYTNLCQAFPPKPNCDHRFPVIYLFSFSSLSKLLINSQVNTKKDIFTIRSMLSSFRFTIVFKSDPAYPNISRVFLISRHHLAALYKSSGGTPVLEHISSSVASVTLFPHPTLSYTYFSLIPLCFNQAPNNNSTLINSNHFQLRLQFNFTIIIHLFQFSQLVNPNISFALFH